MAEARDKAARGLMIAQNIIGGYMYLRSLIGPGNLLYAFYDMPDLIHDCMQAWLRLADAHHRPPPAACHARRGLLRRGHLLQPRAAHLARHDARVPPALLPAADRQHQGPADRPQRHLYVQIDTDGYAVPVIPVYRESIGMDVMSPFEVASGCDVVEIGRQYPDLVIFGGIDKRVLAQGRQAIDHHLEYILPAMRARGGYIPTCDHGVPAEVPYQDYLYYRQRCLELGG